MASSPSPASRIVNLFTKHTLIDLVFWFHFAKSPNEIFVFFWTQLGLIKKTNCNSNTAKMNFLFVWRSLIWGPDVLFCGLSWNLSFFQAKWPFSLISRACGWIYKAADRREQHSWSRLHLIFESIIHLQCAIMVIRPCAESRRLSQAKRSSFSSSDYTVHFVPPQPQRRSLLIQKIFHFQFHTEPNTPKMDPSATDWMNQRRAGRFVFT